AAALEIRGPVVLGNLALPARTVLELDRGVRVLCRILRRGDLGDNSAVVLLIIHPDVADRHVLDSDLAARLAHDVFHPNEIFLFAAVAALLAAVPPLLVRDPMRAAGARDRLVATLVVDLPDETFLCRYVFVHLLDGVFFRLSGH